MRKLAGLIIVLTPLAAAAQVPYMPPANPYGYPPAGGGFGVNPNAVPYGTGGYGPGGYAPGGYAPNGYPQYDYSPNGYPPNGYGPNGYPGPPAQFGPPPNGALDLNAPSFDAATGPAIDDPAFGPGPLRRPAASSAAMPQGPFSPVIPPHRPLSVRDYARTAIDAPEPQQIMLHDIVTILVDEKAELLVQSRFDRQRNATFKAELREFLRIDDDFNLATAAPDSPTIDANLRARLQSDGTTTDREGIRYRIAATVVGVLPNGNVVLEARKAIRSNDGLWEYTLTGTIASRDIKRDYTAVSENVANLQIEKTQKGKIADSTQRPWGMWLYDRLAPF